MALDTARSVAQRHLAGTLPRRWKHVQGVAARAESISPHFDDGPLLVSACWLHDVGYAPDLVETRFHPLDGARALRKWGVDEMVCGLVAFHSAAIHEAEVLGLTGELSAFADPHGIVRDLLWYLDMTTNPDGAEVSFEQRMDDVQARYSADHYVVRALDTSMTDRRCAVDRARIWLSEAGLDGPLQVGVAGDRSRVRRWQVSKRADQ